MPLGVSAETVATISLVELIVILLISIGLGFYIEKVKLFANTTRVLIVLQLICLGGACFVAHPDTGLAYALLTSGASCFSWVLSIVTISYCAEVSFPMEPSLAIGAKTVI